MRVFSENNFHNILYFYVKILVCRLSSKYWENFTITINYIDNCTVYCTYACTDIVPELCSIIYEQISVVQYTEPPTIIIMFYK